MRVFHSPKCPHTKERTVSLRNLSVKLEERDPLRHVFNADPFTYAHRSLARRKKENETEKRNEAGNGSCHEVYITLDVAYIATAFAG